MAKDFKVHWKTGHTLNVSAHRVKVDGGCASFTDDRDNLVALVPLHEVRLVEDIKADKVVLTPPSPAKAGAAF